MLRMGCDTAGKGRARAGGNVITAGAPLIINPGYRPRKQNHQISIKSLCEAIL
jgi:hypothetical protein